MPARTPRSARTSACSAGCSARSCGTRPATTCSSSSRSVRRRAVDARRDGRSPLGTLRDDARRAIDRRPAAPHPGLRLAGRCWPTPPRTSTTSAAAATTAMHGSRPQVGSLAATMDHLAAGRRRRRGDPAAGRRPARRAGDHGPPDRGPPPDRARRARRRRPAAGRPIGGRRRLGRQRRHRPPARPCTSSRCGRPPSCGCPSCASPTRSTRPCATTRPACSRSSRQLERDLERLVGERWARRRRRHRRRAHGVVDRRRPRRQPVRHRRRAAHGDGPPGARPRSATTSPSCGACRIELSMSSRLVTPTAELRGPRRRVRRRLAVPRRRAVPAGAARDVRPAVRPRRRRARPDCRRRPDGAAAGGAAPGVRVARRRSPTTSPSSRRRCGTHGAAALAAAIVEPVRRAVVTFGAHLCGLDMRQNATVHERGRRRAAGRRRGVRATTSTLDEAARLAVLTAELRWPRPLRTPVRRATASDDGTELDVLEAAADAVGRLGPGAIPHYVISGADVGERRARGRRAAARGRAGPPDAVAAEQRSTSCRCSRRSTTSQRGHEVLAALLDHPLYAAPRRRSRRPPGGDDRVLRLEQGRRLPRRQLGAVAGPGARSSPWPGPAACGCGCSTAAAAPSAAAAARPTRRSSPSRPARSTGSCGSPSRARWSPPSTPSRRRPGATWRSSSPPRSRRRPGIDADLGAEAAPFAAAMTTLADTALDARTGRSSTRSPASPSSSPRSRRSGRSRRSTSAAARRRGPARAGSRTSGRSPGCSAGRSAG